MFVKCLVVELLTSRILYEIIIIIIIISIVEPEELHFKSSEINGC